MPDGTSDVADETHLATQNKVGNSERTDCSQRGTDPAELPTYAGLSMLGI